MVNTHGIMGLLLRRVYQLRIGSIFYDFKKKICKALHLDDLVLQFPIYLIIICYTVCRQKGWHYGEERRIIRNHG